MSEPQPEPAPSPYYPPLPHSHDKFVGAIIAAGVIAVIVGGTLGYAFGYGLGNSKGYDSGYDSVYAAGRTSGYDTGYAAASNAQRRFTFAHGTVDIGRSGSQYYPDSIFFDNQNTGTLASPIFADDTYQLYLESGRAYQVTIYWFESTSTSRELRECQARPQPFTPTGTSYTQNFVC